MDRTSRNAILVGIAALFAMQLLIVPWKGRLAGTVLEGLAGGRGYRPIWQGDGSSIDVARLGLQLAITAIVAGVVYFGTRKA